MKKFGLVVLGAHTTNHTRDEIEKFREKPILLIEPVPANVIAIKENLKDFANVIICLLYTSPSPRDGLLSRMPSSA